MHGNILKKIYVFIFTDFVIKLMELMNEYSILPNRRSHGWLIVMSLATYGENNFLVCLFYYSTSFINYKIDYFIH